MTPEERFQRMENALEHASELQAQHAEQLQKHGAAMAELREMHKGLIVAVRKNTEQIAILIADTDRFHDEMREFTRTLERFLKGQRPNGH